MRPLRDLLGGLFACTLATSAMAQSVTIGTNANPTLDPHYLF